MRLRKRLAGAEPRDHRGMLVATEKQANRPEVLAGATIFLDLLMT